MSNVIDKLAESELIKVSERIIISVYLYDREGIITKDSSHAYTEKIIIKKDICSKSLTQDYADINKYGEGNKSEVSIYGETEDDDNIYITVFVDSIEEIANKIIRYLFVVDNIDLSVIGSDISEIWITEELSKAIFNKFTNINISLMNAAIEIDGGDKRLKSLSVTGCGAIKLKNSLSITSGVVTIDNMVLSSNLENKVLEFNIISNNINLNEISVITPITIYTACEKTNTYNEYKETQCIINNLSYKFSDNVVTNPETVYDLEDTSIFDNALLSVADFYNANISGITITNAHCYKGIRFYHLNEVHLSNFNRTTDKNIGNYSIGLSDINRIYLNDIVVSSGYAYGSNNEFAIFIGDKGLSNLQTLNINNITLNNVYLMNLTNCKADKIIVSNCTTVSESFIQSDRTCGVNHLTLSNLNLTSDHPLNIYCPDLYIYDSNIILNGLTSGNTSEFDITKTFKLKNTRFTGDDSGLKINMHYDSNVDISDSELIFKNFEIKYIDNEYDEVFTGIMSENNKVLYFKDSNITANDKINIDGAYRLSSSKSSFNSKEIEISDIDNVSFNEIASTLNNIIQYKFSNCLFRNTIISARNVVSNNSLELDSCNGSISYKVEDIDSNEENSISMNIKLKKSNIDLTLDTVGLPIKVNLVSDDSLGSYVYGNNSSINIIPSMKSIDLTSFKNIAEISESESDKINYGNSNKELTVENLLGIE